MKKLIQISIIISFLVLLCMSVSVMGADTVYVDDDFNAGTPGWGVTNFSSIQRAIENVSDNGTVYVAPGYYWENNVAWAGTACVVNISKPLNLIGEDRNTTIINGTHDRQILIYSSNVVVDNFSLWGMSQGTALEVLTNWANTTNVTISNCFANDTTTTLIYVNTGVNPNNNHSISHITIENCKFNTTAWTCVKFQDSASSVYLNQEIHNCSIINNTFRTRGLAFYGSDVGRVHHNLISGNTFNGSSSNYPAIRLYTVESWYNTVTFNDMQNQQFGGIQIAGQFNVIHNNTVNCSNPDTYGINMTGGENNTIYHNDLLNNTQNGWDEGNNNVWYNSTLSEGNHWSNYDEPSEGAWDNNSNGIVDDPYDIPGSAGAQDLFPLTGQPPLTSVGIPPVRLTEHVENDPSKVILVALVSMFLILGILFYLWNVFKKGEFDIETFLGIIIVTVVLVIILSFL